MVYNEITFHSDASTLEYQDFAIWTFNSVYTWQDCENM